MKKSNFLYIALGLGILLVFVVNKGSQIDDGKTSIPLLTLLAISEVAFIVTAIGAYIGIREIRSNGFKLIDTTITIFCALLSARFLILGIDLWPLW